VCFTCRKINAINLTQHVSLFVAAAGLIACSAVFVTHLNNRSAFLFLVIRFLPKEKHLSAGNKTLLAAEELCPQSLGHLEVLAPLFSDVLFRLRILEVFVYRW
jgi:hypothetical protein